MVPRFERAETDADSSWRCFVRRQPRFDFCWHLHRECELALITRGSGFRHVGSTVEPYRCGDVTLLGPALPHTFVSDVTEPVAEAVIAQFRPDFLGAGFFALPQFARVETLLREADRGVSFPDPPPAAVAILRRLPRLEPARRTVALLELLCALADQDCRWRVLSTVRPRWTDPAGNQVDRVCRFLEHAHTRQITLADAAAVAHLTPGSFGRFFRRVTGRTFTQHLNALRLETACGLLRDSDVPVVEVAMRSGFRNLSYFNRRFRERTGVTPRRYRAGFRTPNTRVLRDIDTPTSLA